MIRVENLSKAYGERMALNRCSFSVPAGHIVGLVGKNGAGKTTALRILSGQTLPTEGEVWIGGHALSREGIAIRARIGYLPETPPLYPEMTVQSYLRFACRLRGIDASQAPARVRDVIGRTGLDGAAGQRLGTLARGYRQRVGIAQAIVHDPPVVLLDEPLSGLDPLQIVQIRDLILALKPHHTVLFSSHILSEVTQVCDSVVLLDQGMVKAEGSEEKLRLEMLQRRTLKLLVRGDAQALTRALSALKGNDVKVRAAHGGAAGVVEAEITGQEDVREKASKLCVEAGLGLLELREERHGLEALMLQLLEREHAA
jgi:ABC-2 type transport system ATP-binding protein